MYELLGVVFGMAIGSIASTLRSRRLRTAGLLVAVVAAGVFTSAVNGELGSELWAVFVSVDTLLAAVGVALGAAIVRLLSSRGRPLHHHEG